MSKHTPTHIKLLQKSHVLEIAFDNGEQFSLPCEYLRASSPSADARASNKPNVNIVGIDPVGNYAIKLIFDDGHNTGIYSWDLLYDLGKKLNLS
jgi:DUF971 family protein